MKKQSEIYLIIQFFITIAYTITSIVLLKIKNADPNVMHAVLDVGIFLFFTMSLIGLLQHLLIEYNKADSSKSMLGFNEILDSLSEYLIIIDDKLQPLYFSTKLPALLGMTVEEMITNPIVTSDGINVTEILNDEILYNEGTFPLHDFIVYNKKTGKDVALNLYLAPARLGESKLFIIVINDQTSHIQEEKKFADELSNAIEVGKEKTVFLSRVSHEIRTPLNGIIGMNEIAKENLNNGDLISLRDSLDKIEFSSKYLLSIIENVLSMSRLEAGRVLIENKTISVTSLISDIETVVSSQITARNQMFNVVTNFDNLFIQADETKLTQILVNIIGNSIKYTNPGGAITLKATSTELINGRVELVFTIKDNGIGMSPEFAKKMFEPFSQEGKQKGVSGTGLGLAITKSLITLLNGTIDVNSKEGVGTTTDIKFIFNKVETGNNEVIKAKDYELIDFSKYRVLVAEDNSINVIVIKNHLTHFKFDVDIAEDGLEAVHKFVNSPIGYYDFILMDIHMPNMDGYEATKEIRESDRKDSNVPIIALTADALKEDISKALFNKMNDHIAKPVIREKMIETIYKVLLKENKLDK